MYFPRESPEKNMSFRERTNLHISKSCEMNISLNCLYLFVSTWELNIYFNYVFRNTFFLLFELMSEISHDMICKTKKPREIWQDGNICYVQYLSQPIKYQKNKCTLHWVTHCHCTKYVLLYVYMSAAFIDFLMFMMKCLRV